MTARRARLLLVTYVVLVAAAMWAGHGKAEGLEPVVHQMPAGLSAERQIAWLEKRVATHRYVCRNGNRRWRRTATHCRALAWRAKQLAATRARLVPVGEAQIRAYLHSILDDDSAECLATIIEWETAGTWDPTISYGGGHGNTSVAYGLPQAYPGTKMASAGPDWRTNPKTQIRWMIRYATDRYGSPCGAYVNRRDKGTY